MGLETVLRCPICGVQTNGTLTDAWAMRLAGELDTCGTVGAELESINTGGARKHQRPEIHICLERTDSFLLPGAMLC